MIENVSVNDDGTIIINYTHNDDLILEKCLKWIKNIVLDPTTGRFTVTYNHDTNATGEPTTYTTYLDWINNVDFNTNNGTLTFGHTHGADTIFTNAIKWPSNISINTGVTEGEGNQKLHITWNNGNELDIGNPINYIMDMQVNNNNHLLVKYSDPARRQ